ncbi:hypothetical protein GWK47_011080 [Chionoecetes opilio]|uniref:Uncharacterized protein n=1 Tax=Chionoecetes opilio TaxID=41210 RepID=A0A8J4XY40_CHIOP|nr:hypothetical protein GWK47_011080 [Chionoecetes opilio]
MGHVLLYIKLVFPCFLPCFGVVCVSEILETSGSNSLRLLPCSHPKDTKRVLRAAPLAVNVWPVNSYQRYYFLLLQQPLKVVPTSEDHHDAYKKAEAQENVGNTKPHRRHDAAVGPLPEPKPPLHLDHASFKRPMDHGSDTNSDPSSSPAAKTSSAVWPPLTIERLTTTYLVLLLRLHLCCSHLLLSAFAPRDEYVKIAFKENPSCDVKLRWLSEVTKVFCLDREQAEVKMSAVTSQFRIHLEAPQRHH